MSHREFLERQAERALRNEGAIPIDLHYRMLGEGLDTETIERQLRRKIEADNG